jgi:DNA-binding HxlR family transcriptional regulator
MKRCNADVFNAHCPSRKLLELLSEKWSLLLIHALMDGAHRTAELRREVGGISEKMLIQTLRRLERHGIIERRAYAEVPPRVEYRLSSLGKSLSEPVRALDEWVEHNLPDVVKAQHRFDAAH